PAGNAVRGPAVRRDAGLTRRFGMRVAMYARVSRLDQEPDNQLHELRRYVAARGWDAVAFVEHGVSGAKDRRPVLDQLLADVRRGRFDAVVCWKLDRLGRNMRHLVTLLDELRALDVGFVTIGEGLDTTTPAGRMTFRDHRGGRRVRTRTHTRADHAGARSA